MYIHLLPQYVLRQKNKYEYQYVTYCYHFVMTLQFKVYRTEHVVLCECRIVFRPTSHMDFGILGVSEIPKEKEITIIAIYLSIISLAVPLLSHSHATETLLSRMTHQLYV